MMGDGAGGFGEPTAFGAGAGPNSVVAGDFNGDGKPDLAVANSSGFFDASPSVRNTVSLLLNTCAASGNSPGQINYLVPPGTATGAATISALNGNNTVATGAVQISPVAPGLFAANANGQGVASAVVLRVSGGIQSFEAVAVFDQAQNRFVTRPIDLGPVTDQVFLILFGTGIRGRSALAKAPVSIGGVEIPAFYAGAQGDFAGLDQINLPLPRALAGRGEMDVVLAVDGVTANSVRVSIK